MRTIVDLKNNLTRLLVLAGLSILVSCASDRSQVALVDDPAARGDSAIPWNKQEKWETGGQFANMTDRR